MTSRFTPRWYAGATLLGALLLGACDFTVTNPGPVQDSQLNTPSAMPALVNGMSGDLSFALGNYIDRGALFAGELTHSGNFAAEGHFYRGTVTSDDVIGDWGRMQTARFSAEDGLRRMQQVLGSGFETSPLTARAYLYGGFANRFLGENVCTGVIDGGPAQSDSVYFVRAESLFTRAYTIATALKVDSLAKAALAGRATVRAWQGNWTGAAADAAQVPTAFAYNAIFSTNTPRENNDLAVQTISRRETTVWDTPWDSTRSDPRTPWDTVKTTAGKVQTGQDGKTPFFRQKKYTSLGSLVPLAKGTEMLLLRAEERLRANDLPTAVTLINQERAFYKLPAVAPTTVDAAYTQLEAERGAVLWLEGRRLWDLRRWFVEGKNDFLANRDKCVPISSTELGSNPNLN
ncbi:MAG TPA: RagB/SusD family nutrient uptake outer membrane protein [Gemmatimonadaceae bacterium]|nr:RagB/SusD family nutrient uptake outer membrane protein [Gemmatimonadaceae bacterium]